jgi:hypothetical protein
MSNNEIQALIQSFATQLEAAAKKAAIEQVLASIGGSASAPTRRGRGPGRPKGSTNKSAAAPATGSPIMKVRAGKRRSAEDVEAMGTALTDYVRANPGERGEQIAAALRSDVGTIRLPMKALIAARKIKTQGERRGMKYFVAGATPTGTAPKGAKKERRAKRGRKQTGGAQSMRQRLVRLSAKARK